MEFNPSELSHRLVDANRTAEPQSPPHELDFCLNKLMMWGRGRTRAPPTFLFGPRKQGKVPMTTCHAPAGSWIVLASVAMLLAPAMSSAQAPADEPTPTDG